MNNIKVFTAIGAVVAFNGYAANTFAAINSNNEDSEFDQSAAEWFREKDGECIKSDYDANATKDEKAKTFYSKHGLNLGDEIIDTNEPNQLASYQGLCGYKNTRNPDGTLGELSRDDDRVVVDGVVIAKSPAWSSCSAKEYEQKHVTKFLRNECRSGTTNIGYTEVTYTQNCDNDPNDDKYPDCNFPGAISKTETKNECKPKEGYPTVTEVPIYECPRYFCEICDICYAASYPICAVSYDNPEKGNTSGGDGADYCNVSLSNDFYGEFASFVGAITGTGQIQGEREAGNFYIGLRAQHEIGPRGQASQREKDAMVDQGTELILSADEQYVQEGLGRSKSQVNKKLSDIVGKIRRNNAHAHGVDKGKRLYSATGKSVGAHGSANENALNVNRNNLGARGQQSDFMRDAQVRINEATGTNIYTTTQTRVDNKGNVTTKEVTQKINKSAYKKRVDADGNEVKRNDIDARNALREKKAKAKENNN